MEKLFKYLLIGGMIIYCIGCTETDSTDRLDRYMQAEAEINRFNGVVLVAKNGTPVYRKAFGYANYDTKEPLTLNSMFNLGSVTKQMTAMGILLLQQQGKLRLSDSLRKYIPELPYSGITIRHLLTHTSGMPDHAEAMEAKWDHKKVAFNADMIKFLVREKLPVRFKPGQKWEYSNTGYALLASIIEKSSGQSFQQFMAQHIFAPLEMSRSRVFNTRHSSKEVIPDFAYGVTYMDSLDSYKHPDQVAGSEMAYYLDGIQGQGRIHSTVGDLLKWDRALKNHTLLPEAMQREMLSKQALVDTVEKEYYGYGIVIGNRDKRDYIEHSGGWPGYVTDVSRYIEDDVTIIVLSNNESDAPKINRALVDIMFGKNVPLPQKRPEIALDTTILNDYVGEYQNEKGRNIVTRKGNQLYFRRMDGTTAKIFPETKSRFFFKNEDAQLDFIRDASGAVVGRTVTIGTVVLEAEKVK